MSRQRAPFGLHVSVVIPAFNEALWIGKTLTGVPTWVASVIVVDDASQDDTCRRVQTYQREAAQGARVTLLAATHNRGVGASIVAGYQAALQQGAEVCVVMAGDNQMDPADLPALLQPIAEGWAQYVKGNRYAHRLHSDIPWLRRAGGQVLSWCTRRATGLDVTDTQCGYTAIHMSLVRRLPLMELWPRYGYPNDLLGLLAQHGVQVAEVPVRPVYAGEASGLRPYHMLVILWIIVRRRWLFATAHPRQPTRPLLQLAKPQSVSTEPS